MRTVSAALFGLSPLCVLLISGCLSTVVCPEGTRGVMGACVGDDAGVPDGGADDAMLTDAFGDDASAPTDGGLPVDARADARGVDAPSDACSLVAFFADADEDGFGDESVVMMGCVAPAGTAWMGLTLLVCTCSHQSPGRPDPGEEPGPPPRR